MEEAYQRALRILGFKGRFQKELEERLRQEGFSEEQIAFAMKKCNPYLDDVELAKAKVRGQAKKGYGARKIAALLQQYISPEEALLEFDEKEALCRYLEKHPKLLCDPKAKGRLLRRGFSFETIQDVFAKYLKHGL